MVTLLVITMLFMLLKVFNLDIMKAHLNQNLVLIVMMIFIWGITFYISHFNKKEMSTLRASLRVHFVLFLLAHTVALFYIVMQVNMSFIEAMNWIYLYNMQFILSFVVIYAIYILVYNLIGKVFLSMILTSCTLVILGIVNYLKLIFRGDPLYPSDFTQIMHMQSVIPMVMDYFSWSYIFCHYLKYRGLYCSRDIYEKVYSKCKDSSRNKSLISSRFYFCSICVR